MANWFQNHPASSILGHTLVVAGAVWAAFYFVFDENKVAVYRAQVETEKATAGQFKAKTEVLEVEISRLRNENRKYLEWMVNTPKTIPYLEERIKALTEENTKQKVQLSKLGQVSKPAPNEGGAALPYTLSRTLNVGEAFVDPQTNATLGIGRISQDFTTNVVVNIPGEKPQEISSVMAGNSWTFRKNDKSYSLTLAKVDWFSNKAEVVIKELVGSSGKTNAFPAPKGQKPTR
jgi:hypothetical protein